MRTSSYLPQERPAALRNPVPTKDRKEAAFNARADYAQAAGIARDSREMVIPALDLPKLSAEWGDYGQKPVWKLGTFTCSVDATLWWYERIRDDALGRFFREMAKLGWELFCDEHHRPRVAPGVYPAHDLRDGIAILDQREFIVGAWFTFPKAKPITLEIPQHIAESKVIRR